MRSLISAAVVRKLPAIISNSDPSSIRRVLLTWNQSIYIGSKRKYRVKGLITFLRYQLANK